MSDLEEILAEIKKLKMEEDRLLDMSQAAELLGVSMPTTYRITKAGDFPAVRIGRLLKVRNKSLLDYVERKDLSRLG